MEDNKPNYNGKKLRTYSKHAAHAAQKDLGVNTTHRGLLLFNKMRNYSASPTAQAWGVWCGGFAATPHYYYLTHAE